VAACAGGHHTTARRSLEKAELQQVGLVDVLKRALVLAERGRERLEPHRAAAVVLDGGDQEAAVELVEAEGVHLQPLEAVPRGLERDARLLAGVGEVPHAAQQPVGDARCAPRALRDLDGSAVPKLDPEQPRRSPDNGGEGVGAVEVQPVHDAEAVAQRGLAAGRRAWWRRRA